MDPLNVLAKFEVHSFTRSRDNSDWSFGWGVNPSLGEGEVVGGRGWYRSKELWWVPIYRLPILTFPLAVPVSEILPLLCSRTPFFPTPPIVYPHLPMFLWELVDGLWATKSEGVGLIVRAVSFQDCQPMWSWSTNVTDGWHAIAIPHFAL